MLNKKILSIHLTLVTADVNLNVGRESPLLSLSVIIKSKKFEATSVNPRITGSSGTRFMGKAIFPQTPNSLALSDKYRRIYPAKSFLASSRGGRNQGLHR